MDRHVYDCDTYGYWCSTEEYNNRNKKFGSFIEDGSAYEINDKNTPRPWLNYLCNHKIASVLSNTGLGFFWYKTSLLRVTKYEHAIDYQPREFVDGREIYIEDRESGEKWHAFRDADQVHCIHRPGYSVIDAVVSGIKVQMTVFVPKEDACECWIIDIKNTGISKRKLIVKYQQTWTFSRFGIHTAEEGIPYLSTPGNKLDVNIDNGKILAHTDNEELPVELWGCFFSPQTTDASVEYDVQKNVDGRVFRFPVCSLNYVLDLEAGSEKSIQVISGADEDKKAFDEMLLRYTNPEAFGHQLSEIKKLWNGLKSNISCSIPDKDMQNFLNVWLKHQIFTTFRYIRSGYIGYRDTLQDTWGYQLVQPELTKVQLLKTLSFMKMDGSCPRNFSPFGFQDKHDLRNTMDSATWIAMCISGYIKETGDAGILEEKIRYLDDENLYTVEEHIQTAFNLLYEMRGLHGLCLVADGDWNDAIEGISKFGPAVSVWLTIATYYAQNILSELFEYLGKKGKAEIFKQRSSELEKAVNEFGWDGEWYLYAISGLGNPVGSHKNRGGKIHLNSNTWALFSGLARGERANKTKEAIKKYLDTPVGPTLLYPPYELDEIEVGRIVNLEPGTFENGSVYQHAVTFKIFADIALGEYEEAYRTFINVLPTNPNNFDARRTSEPYCTGNYYCGPTHDRFGQNFFTWFTGNPAWLLRAGFDEILGVKAEFSGLKIEPKVPESWQSYSVKRVYRGTEYNIKFQRAADCRVKAILADGRKIDGNILPETDKKSVDVQVFF